LQRLAADLAQFRGVWGAVWVIFRRFFYVFAACGGCFVGSGARCNWSSWRGVFFVDLYRFKLIIAANGGESYIKGED